MPTIVATPPGDPNANSYVTLQEATNYFLSRAPVAGWENAADQSALLIHATRVLDAAYSGARVWIPPQGGNDGYYRTLPKWTGTPASSTQSLAWPRIGMYNRNGFPIPSNEIPVDLKYAVCELAGALATSDTTVDNSVAIQGIRSVAAGSVSVSFGDGIVTTKMIPDAVMLYLVPSWLTEESIVTATGASGVEFDVI
jgi:hypothetical protein